jgi:hypothetical protein
VCRELVVICSDAGVVAITRIKIAVAVCCGLLASVTWNPSIVPGEAEVGVPLRTPVAAFSVNPIGSRPEVNAHV